MIGKLKVIKEMAISGPSRITFTGDIQSFKQFTNPNLWQGNLEREIKKATIANALFLIREIKLNIRNSNFEPNSELTLALTRGNKPLLKEKNLFDAIGKKIFNSFTAEVGIVSKRQSTGGVTNQTIQMKKLVELMEDGYIITITQKMIAAINARLQESRTKSGKLTKKAAAGLAVLSGGSGKTFSVVSRPIFSKVFKDDAPRINRIMQANWRKALEGTFKMQGAKDGEHRDR